MYNMNDQNIKIKYIHWWLITCCIFVFTMVFIGGLTRLTHSGL